jgi:prephenate dehydratase
MGELRVAFQGEPGAYSELAALEYFGPQIKTLPCQSFDDVFTAICNEQSTHGMLPVENSLAGSIHRNYDLMLRNELHIVGEYHFRVNHCLLALPGVRLEEIQRVHSHPQALAQCEDSLRKIGVERVAEKDTAGSARLLRERNDREAGALASRRAAEVYRLEILAENMEDDPSNFTRFLALSQQPNGENPKEGVEYKTSIVFSLHNRPGALFKALSVFAG